MPLTVVIMSADSVKALPGQQLPAVKLLAQQMLRQALEMPSDIIILQDAEVSCPVILGNTVCLA